MLGRRTRSRARALADPAAAAGPATGRRARRRPAPGARRPARRRSAAGGAPASVVPLFSIRTDTGWGHRRDRATSPRFARWAQRGGLLGAAAPARERGVAAPTPAPTRRSRPSRSIRSTCPSTNARTSAPPAGGEALPGRAAPELERLAARALVDWPRRARPQGRPASRWRSATSSTTNGRSRPAARDAARRVHAARTATGWTTTRCSPCCTSIRQAAGWTGPRGRATETPDAIAARAQRARRAAAARGMGAVAARRGSGARARREASAAGVELMGDLPFTVGVDSADVWANRGLFRIDQHVGTPPDEGAPEGQDWGLPVYDWSVLARNELLLDPARAPSGPASCSASTASITRSASTGPTSGRPTARPAGSPRRDEGDADPARASA